MSVSPYALKPVRTVLGSLFALLVATNGDSINTCTQSNLESSSVSLPVPATLCHGNRPTDQPPSSSTITVTSAASDFPNSPILPSAKSNPNDYTTRSYELFNGMLKVYP